MEAEITKEGPVTIVRLIGLVDFETSLPFRKNCLERLSDTKVIFNFQDLNFVGSSGITPFFETLRDFSVKANIKPKFCGMASEFRRIFSATGLEELEIFENQVGAVNAFKAPMSAVQFTPELPALDEPWVEEKI